MLLSSLVLAAAQLAPPTAPAGPGVELWIAAGQSQMVGFNGGFGQRDASLGGPDRLPENVWMLDLTDRAVPAGQPLALPLVELPLQGQHDNVSPVIRFAQERAWASPDRRIAIVFVASNGAGVTQSSIDRNWAAPGSPLHVPGALYDRLIARTEAALAEFGAVRPNGLLWAQGESDSFLGASAYGQEFGLILDGLRAHFDPALPVMIAGIPPSSELAFPGVGQLDQFFFGLAQADPLVAYVRPNGFQLVDFVHYDAPSCRVLGGRFAEASWQFLPPSGSPFGTIVPSGQAPRGGPPGLGLGALLVQRATGGAADTLFASRSAAAGSEPAPAGQFSRLEEFESSRQTDGSFHLELTYWMGGQELLRVRWRQHTNPMTVSRDHVRGFAYRADTPAVLPIGQFRGIARTTVPGGLLGARPGATDFEGSPTLAQFRCQPMLVGDPTQLTLGWTPDGQRFDRVTLVALPFGP